jgi:hypothetical protein
MKKSVIFCPEILGIIVLSLFLLQCKKDSTPTPTPPSQLILGSWVVTADNYNPAYDYLGNGTPVTDAFPLYDACLKDNVYIFKTNSEGEYNEGETKCNATDPQSVAFLWTLKNNNTVLNISALADFNIVQLDGSKLKLSSTSVENGVTYTSTVTMVKK